MDKAAGMYHLQEVKETASGFKLHPNGVFQFFFTYGAIDRYGSGNWTVEDDQVVLQSRAWPGNDFAGVDSKVIDQDFISTKIVGNKTVLLRDVYFCLSIGETG